jgi:hypothetical protein
MITAIRELVRDELKRFGIHHLSLFLEDYTMARLAEARGIELQESEGIETAMPHYFDSLELLDRQRLAGECHRLAMRIEDKKLISMYEGALRNVMKTNGDRPYKGGVYNKFMEEKLEAA